MGPHPRRTVPPTRRATCAPGAPGTPWATWAPLTWLAAVLALTVSCGVPLETPSDPAAPATRAGAPSASRTPGATALPAAPAPSVTREVPASPSPGARATALAVLDGLEVKGRAPLTGYDRDLFGQPWLDVDRNGCDTRNDVLGGDAGGARDEARHPWLQGPRRGARRPLHRRRHRLPLPRRRCDRRRPRGGAGQRLGHRRVRLERRDPRGVRERPAQPVGRRRLGQPAEGRRRRRDLAAAAHGVPVRLRRPAGCGEGHLRAVGHPGGGRRRTPGARRLPGAAGAARGRHAGPSCSRSDDPGRSTAYASCDEARAAGAAPLRRGERGYASALDGDDDGVACE